MSCNVAKKMTLPPECITLCYPQGAFCLLLSHEGEASRLSPRGGLGDKMHARCAFLGLKDFSFWFCLPKVQDLHLARKKNILHYQFSQ